MSKVFPISAEIPLSQDPRDLFYPEKVRPVAANIRCMRSMRWATSRLADSRCDQSPYLSSIDGILIFILFHAIRFGICSR
jgi:hypothetical protein